MRIRDHCFGVTLGLTIGSLILVFGAVLQVLPVNAVPHPTSLLNAIPHVNVLLSIGGIIAISLGWFWIKHRDIKRHRLAMLTAMILFLTFLILYLFRVSLLGPTTFPGPDPIYSYMYLPILTIHVILAIICLPLLYYVLLIGLTHTITEIPRTRHSQIGRVAAPLWITSFSLGILVYTLLYVIY